jgi:hypothetical protein
MSLEPHIIVGLARRYCRLIETSGDADPAWLAEVAALLPRLHAAVVSLDAVDLGEEHHLTPDLDARFELFSHLRDLLGERDGYWLEFDRLGDAEHMTGSLADDLTDIYCELKHGLRLVDSHQRGALRGWREGFEGHWGQHLFDAQRHLSALAAEDRLLA